MSVAFAKAEKAQRQEPAAALAELDRQVKAASEAEGTHNYRLEQTVNQIRTVERRIGEFDVEYINLCRRSADGETVDLGTLTSAIEMQKAKLNGLQQVEAELRAGAAPLIAARMQAWAIWKRAENAAELERLREAERMAILKRDAAKADVERTMRDHAQALVAIAQHMKRMRADEQTAADNGVPSSAALDWEEQKRRAIA